MAQDKKSRILVVNNNLRNTELLEAYLSNESYEVVKVSDGGEALRQVKGGSFGLILLDIMMPKLNGYQVCKRIKEDVKTKFIPVVMIISLPRSEDKVIGIGMGANDFL